MAAASQPAKCQLAMLTLKEAAEQQDLMCGVRRQLPSVD